MAKTVKRLVAVLFKDMVIIFLNFITICTNILLIVLIASAEINSSVRMSRIYKYSCNS